MGIKNYLKFLEQTELNDNINNYDYLYLDCNYLLHYLIYKCKNNSDLYYKLYAYTSYLLQNIVINKIIYIIFDGDYDKNFLINPKENTHITRSKYKIKSDDYDKQDIHPKSKIVEIFKDYINKILLLHKTKHNYTFDLIVNDDEIDGEADFKFLNTIYNSNQDNICILSKDTDIVLIAYSLIIDKKININILSNLRPITFIEINKLSKLKNTIINSNYKNDRNHDIKFISIDYVLLVLLLGNDYLPKLSNVNYELLIETYYKYLSYGYENIIQNYKFNYKNFINFIDIIIIKNNIKLNIKKLDVDRYKIYFNNLCWCLWQYKILNDTYNYIPISNNIIYIYNYLFI